MLQIKNNQSQLNFLHSDKTELLKGICNWLLWVSTHHCSIQYFNRHVWKFEPWQFINYCNTNQQSCRLPAGLDDIVQSCIYILHYLYGLLLGAATVYPTHDLTKDTLIILFYHHFLTQF